MLVKKALLTKTGTIRFYYINKKNLSKYGITKGIYHRFHILEKITKPIKILKTIAVVTLRIENYGNSGHKITITVDYAKEVLINEVLEQQKKMEKQIYTGVSEFLGYGLADLIETDNAIIGYSTDSSWVEMLEARIRNRRSNDFENAIRNG